MKLLLVNDFNETVGGTEIYVNSLANELIKQGHQIKIFTGDKTYSQNQSESLFKKLPRLFFSISYLKKFSKVLNNFLPDAIIVNNFLYELSPSFLLAIRNIPTIMIVHDSQLFSPKAIAANKTGKKCKTRMCEGCLNCMGPIKAPLEKIKRKFHRQLIKKVDLFIGNSEYINSLIYKANLGRVVHIKFGIQLPEFKPVRNWENITYIGRLTEEKGIHCLIKALRIVVKKNPNIYLNIVGDGPFRIQLEELAKKLNVTQHANFFGARTHKETLEFICEATAIIVPSTWSEPFSISGIEAMSIGRPVIGSNIGGIPEWLKDGENGYLTKPNCPDDLASAIITLLSNRRKIVTMGANARCSAESYSIQNHCYELIKLVSKMCEKS